MTVRFASRTKDVLVPLLSELHLLKRCKSRAEGMGCRTTYFQRVQDHTFWRVLFENDQPVSIYRAFPVEGEYGFYFEDELPWGK